ncbi:putative peptide transporter ptr2 [Smittium mucronatum]|uniref:Putative peptide transporter ptr2 n=1 Tax=Smittium mucronatum TaxID=133383 RepID=A0A1R0H198_9FUNG|nr:putative peptide transporter ptr2 [Smittium mucronatum]
MEKLEDNSIEVTQLLTRPKDYVKGVPGNIKLASKLVIVTELCERFTFYGITVMLPNYLIDGFGMTSAGTVLRAKIFSFLAYFFTIVGALVADEWFGKFRTVMAFSVWYLVGTVIMSATSMDHLPESTREIGFMVAIYAFIAFGTGGIKANVSSFVAEQVDPEFKQTSKPGIYIDPKLAVQRCYRYFYWAINTGAIFGLAVCPQLVKRFGYYAGFWSTAVVNFVGFAIFFLGRSRYIMMNPSESALKKTIMCVRYAWARRGTDGGSGVIHWLDHAKGDHTEPWDDEFVDGLKRCITVIKILSFLPIYWMLYMNVSDNFILQARRMTEPSWISSDQLILMVQLSIVVLIPVYDRFLIPFLLHRNIKFGPIKRIVIGFLLITLGFVYATITQVRIYRSPPFYNFEGADISAKNDISLWWQIPAFVLLGSSEIFASVTSLEIAYALSPPELKSLMNSFALFTICIGNLLGMSLSSLSYDPMILNVYIGEAVAMLITTIAFFFCFRHFDKTY